MDDNKTGGTAFPAAEVWDRDLQRVTHKQTQGMTLRDYFAAKAMQGLMASQNTGSYEQFAMHAYKVAAAMLAERDKQKQEGM